MVLVAALEQAQDGPSQPFIVLKGGTAMELRFQLIARPTKDVDLVLLVPADVGLERVREALTTAWSDFAFTAGAPARIRALDSWRLDVAISYRGRSWQTVRLEIAETEGELAGDIEDVPAVSISIFGLREAPDKVSCLGVSYQIAQKLHACTERSEDRETTGCAIFQTSSSSRTLFRTGRGYAVHALTSLLFATSTLGRPSSFRRRHGMTGTPESSPISSFPSALSMRLSSESAP